MWPKAMNIGCGNNYREGYLNVDLSIDHGVRAETMTAEEKHLAPVLVHDLLSPAGLPTEYFREVYARMVMEHVHIDLVPTVLYTLNCVMEDKGELIIIVPDFEEIVNVYKYYGMEELNIKKFTYLREMTFHLLDPLIKGENGRGHQSLWTPALATYWLEGEGFVVSKIEKNYEPFSMKIIAYKDSPFSVATPIRKDYKK